MPESELPRAPRDTAHQALFADPDLVLDAVGEAQRRTILRRLQSGPSPVAELARELPVSRPAVSQHLRVLLDAGLVVFERQGTRNLYRLNPNGIRPLRQGIDDIWGVALESYAARAEELARDDKQDSNQDLGVQS
jgi:DNA-binding transcriptional ArsR family regulator